MAYLSAFTFGSVRVELANALAICVTRKIGENIADPSDVGKGGSAPPLRGTTICYAPNYDLLRLTAAPEAFTPESVVSPWLIQQFMVGPRGAKGPANS